MQYGPFAVDDERVSCVVPTLETDHCMRTLGQKIYDCAFSLIAPLSADYDDVTAHRVQPLTK